jgi:hypothetical protein
MKFYKTKKFKKDQTNKTIALKIFQLGSKKFGQIPEYMLAYLDYMAHLNGMFQKKKKISTGGTL